MNVKEKTTSDGSPTVRVNRILMYVLIIFYVAVRSYREDAR